MRIYLIGFMGTGKTTLGRQVSARLDIPFFDTDEMIVSQMKKSIPHIFSHEGEEVFRKQEAEVLRQTAGFDKSLIATGGGLPVYHSNMDWLTEHGITMYLQWPDEILLASLVHHKSLRPLLSNLSDEDAARKARQLLIERKLFYEMSSMTLELVGDFEEDCKTVERACKYIW